MRREHAVLQDEATDAELACRAAAGDLEAFESLYRRHVEAAWRMALTVTTNPDDAADAVSDAFARVFQALPERLHAADYFLPYLLAAVRNAAIDVLRRGGRQRVVDPREQPDSPVTGGEPADLVVAGSDAAIMARAFRSLPERWRSVLWLTEVEGIPAREVAGLLGVSANGVAQLAVRARAGLRQRYLQAHLRDTNVGSLCRDTVDRMGAYAAGGLPPRDIAKVDQHLAGCETCRARLAELEDMAPGLRRAVLPLPAGLAALTLGKWKLASGGASASTGATASAGAGSTGTSGAAVTGAGAGTAGPVGIGVGGAVVGVPGSLVTSLASMALLVAGLVGVGVVEHGEAGPVTPPVAGATTPQSSFAAAAAAPGSEHGSPVDAAVAMLVAESARAAAELFSLTDAVAALPAGLPEVAPPDAEQIQGLIAGHVGLDLKAIAVDADLGDGSPACHSIRVMGATITCQLPAEVPTIPAGPPPAAGAATDAAARAEAAAAEAARVAGDAAHAVPDPSEAAETLPDAPAPADAVGPAPG